MTDVKVTVVETPKGTEAGDAAVAPIDGGEILMVAVPDFVESWKDWAVTVTTPDDEWVAAAVKSPLDEMLPESTVHETFDVYRPVPTTDAVH